MTSDKLVDNRLRAWLQECPPLCRILESAGFQLSELLQRAGYSDTVRGMQCTFSGHRPCCNLVYCDLLGGKSSSQAQAPMAAAVPGAFISVPRLCCCISEAVRKT